jgi:hypothetical protein
MAVDLYGFETTGYVGQSAAYRPVQSWTAFPYGEFVDSEEYFVKQGFTQEQAKVAVLNIDLAKSIAVQDAKERMNLFLGILAAAGSLALYFYFKKK